MTMTPSVSVVVRSYNRLPTLPALLDVLLAQAYANFDVVVIDQSTDQPADAMAALALRQSDTKLRWFHYSPLGGAKARNVGVSHATGDIVLFVDDDDMPQGTDWIAKHIKNYEDPNCVGVTGHQDFGRGENPYAWYSWSERRCMSFAWPTMLPWTYGQRTTRKPKIDYVHGTNGSLRRRVIEAVGGWDEDTSVEDESSFGYKAKRALAPQEYVCFDPVPSVRRGVSSEGGLAKRFVSTDRFIERYCRFVLVIIGRYYPHRVRWLFLLYWAWLVRHAIDWIWDDSQLHDTWRKRMPATIAAPFLVPWVYLRTWWRLGRQHQRPIQRVKTM